MNFKISNLIFLVFKPENRFWERHPGYLKIGRFIKSGKHEIFIYIGKILFKPNQTKTYISIKSLLTCLLHSIFYLSIISGLESPVSALHWYNTSIKTSLELYQSSRTQNQADAPSNIKKPFNNRQYVCYTTFLQQSSFIMYCCLTTVA